MPEENLTTPAMQLKADATFCSESRPNATGYVLFIWDDEGNASIRTCGSQPTSGYTHIRTVAQKTFWKDFSNVHQE